MDFPNVFPQDILSFWLGKGVSGFRVSSASSLFENTDLTHDEPICTHVSVPNTSYSYLDHILTSYQPETYQIVTEWRELLDNVSSAQEVPSDRSVCICSANRGSINS